MKPASTTSSAPRSSSQSASAPSRCARSRLVRQREDRRLHARAPRARSSPRASARLDATPTISIRPSRPWTVSSSAWRFVPSPETRTAIRKHVRRRGDGSLSTGYGPPVVSSAPSLDQLVHAREYVGPPHVRRHAVGGQPVVRVALDLLAARAVQDLRAGRAAHRRPRAASPPRGSRRRGRRSPPGRAAARVERERRRRTRRSSSGAARRRRRCRRSGAGSRRAGSASSSTYAQISRYWRQRARAPSSIDVRQSAAARPSKRPIDPARRRGRARTATGDITPARVRWPSSARSRSPSPRRSRASPARRASSGRRRRPRAMSRSASQPGQARVELLALDEVHVQRLVAVLGQQQRTRRRAVAARAAGLLVVGLERRRHARVHHRAHVRLVHAHAERVGGADHADVVRRGSAAAPRRARSRSSPAW